MVDLLPDQLRLMASAYPDEVAYRLHRDGECAGVGDCEWCNDEVEATHVEESDAF